MATSHKSRWIRQHSAGGVVIRRTGPEVEFLAIKPAHRDRWQLPKGTINRGETPPQAALREVREEGGVHASIVADLGPISFFYQMDGRRYTKTVDFYLMTYQSGNPSDHDHEVQEARWFPLGTSSPLTFPTERGLVDRARAYLQHHRLTGI
jgi:8-oxo-dGTP pyrophosphatase MutT (NUDIX family)